MKMPALFTRMSTRPNRAIAWSAIVRTLASSLTSVRMNSASRPRDLIAAMTSCACSADTLSATTMCAPSRAKAMAMPAPMPEAAPVTTAIR